jgi:hypothetical protein
MIARRKNNILYLEFPLLSGFPGLFNGIFTRHGGYSSAPYDSLNIGKNGSDTAENVRHNRSLIQDCIESSEPLIFVNQVHGADVIVLRREDEPEIPSDLTGDALITDIPGLPMGIQLADCQAILLYDPVNAVAANIHAGWRGSIQNIAGKTVERMQSEFFCQPEHIRAAVSPSLGPCCSEFKNYPTEIPEAFWPYRDSRNHFNFWAITRDQLTGAGVLKENIEFSGMCTRCNDHLFYSYRKNRETGRFAAVIGITDQ